MRDYICFSISHQIISQNVYAKREMQMTSSTKIANFVCFSCLHFKFVEIIGIKFLNFMKCNL